jgi:flavin reductase (DIM6/NTAB) family NADH-FMN oxidoreductase RutF
MSMHVRLDPKVLYFGTPVVLISTDNPDGTANLAPMSSAWWLGRSCMLGLDATSRTPENLLRSRECVLNLCDARMVRAVDRLALLTGCSDLPVHKAEKGFRYEPDKFGAAGLTPVAAVEVSPPRVSESPIQMEARLVSSRRFGAPHAEAFAVEVEVVATHIAPNLVSGQREGHIDPVAWDPLIMKFTEFFAGGKSLHPSRLAIGFGLDHRLRTE